MSPLAAKADCAERTTNAQQTPNGLPSVAVKDRLLQSPQFLQSGQSLSEALPQGSLNTQQRATRWLAPMLPPSAATGSGGSSNGASNNGSGPAAGLHQVTAGEAAAAKGIGAEAMASAAVKQRLARLRAILRRLGATAQANGTRVKICLTAKGLARAKAALLKARSVQQPALGQQVPSSCSEPRGQKPEPMGSGHPMAANSFPTRDRGSAGPQPAVVQADPSNQPQKTKSPAKIKAAPTATQSSAAARSGSDGASNAKASNAKTALGAQKRSRHAAQSVRAGAKGVYTEDSIRVYLQEIGRIRLLRPDEEIELARKIADLLYLEQEAETYFHENERYPSDSEWAEQVSMPCRTFKRRLKLGRRAKEKMVQSNLRLVVSIAKKYMNRGLSFQDLIQEGSLGLVRAAEKFDHEKGYKFSTYATWWIRQAITRAIADQSRTIRLPVHLYETISRIKKSTKTLSQELGRKPSEEEIAERMEMTIEKLRFIAKSAQLPISLETPIGKEEDSRLGDFIESGTENPDQDVAKNLLREDLESVLATLNPRERDVLRLRYGLDDGRMKTLEDIGQIFEVTRERIRQIEAKALRKLRHPNRNGVLKEYIK